MGTQTVTTDTLVEIEKRVLWLSTAIVDAANRRGDPSGLKVGGHQASSASMTTIMTSLWFEHLRAGDRVSVKPHASPVLHAINYLLGELDERYLGTLRAFGGLQSYPSRSKDPDPVDYSTGSVGISGVAGTRKAMNARIIATILKVNGSLRPEAVPRRRLALPRPAPIIGHAPGFAQTRVASALRSRRHLRRLCRALHAKPRRAALRGADPFARAAGLPCRRERRYPDRSPRRRLPPRRSRPAKNRYFPRAWPRRPSSDPCWA